MLVSTFALGTVEKRDSFSIRDFFLVAKPLNISRKDYGAKFSSTVPDCITRGMATNGGSDQMLGNSFSTEDQCSTGTIQKGGAVSDFAGFQAC